MNDSVKITISVPMKKQDVVINHDVIFCDRDGVYVLKAGEYKGMPMPVWEKLSSEIS